MIRITNPKFYTGKVSDIPKGGLRENQIFIDADTGEIFTELSTGLVSSKAGTVKAINGSSRYIAQLTQAGTSDPTVNVLMNETGLDFNWVRTGVGACSVTFTGDYTDKLLVTFPTQNITSSSTVPRLFNYSIEDIVSKSNQTILNIYTTIENGGVDSTKFEGADGQMADAFIMVELLP